MLPAGHPVATLQAATERGVMGNGGLFLILLVLRVIYFMSPPTGKSDSASSSRKGVDKVLSHIPAKPTEESKALARWLLEKAAQQTGIDLSGDLIARKRLDKAAARVLQMI